MIVAFYRNQIFFLTLKIQKKREVEATKHFEISSTFTNTGYTK